MSGIFYGTCRDNIKYLKDINVNNGTLLYDLID